MASHNTENTIEGNLITNVLTHFNKAGDLAGDVVCKVECTICTTELAILQPPDEDHNTWTVLESCGHMFCHECIVAWIDSKSRPDCPVCRTSLSHLYCLHKYKPQEITLTNGFNIHEDVPKVVGELPHRCPDCQSGVATRRMSFSPVSDDGVDDGYDPFVATGRMSPSNVSGGGVGDVYDFSVTAFGSPLGSDSDSDLSDLSDSDSLGLSDDGSELDFGFDRDLYMPPNPFVLARSRVPAYTYTSPTVPPPLPSRALSTSGRDSRPSERSHRTVPSLLQRLTSHHSSTGQSSSEGRHRSSGHSSSTGHSNSSRHHSSRDHHSSSGQRSSSGHHRSSRHRSSSDRHSSSGHSSSRHRDSSDRHHSSRHRSSSGHGSSSRHRSSSEHRNSSRHRRPRTSPADAPPLPPLPPNPFGSGYVRRLPGPVSYGSYPTVGDAPYSYTAHRQY